MKKAFILLVVLLASAFTKVDEPIVTVEKFLKYQEDRSYAKGFKAPETVLVSYQDSVMDYLFTRYPDFQETKAVSNFYTYDQGQIGVLGNWGIGAPALALKMEELIYYGAKRFICIGTAGGLMSKHQIAEFIVCTEALPEDGVAPHYLPKNQKTALADESMQKEWAAFTKERGLPNFQPAMAWSFSAIFRETVADVLRVTKLGCTVVDMEAATVYAISHAKGVHAISLFVISDSITKEGWKLGFREPKVEGNLNKLVDWALEFCKCINLQPKKL